MFLLISVKLSCMHVGPVRTGPHVCKIGAFVSLLKLSFFRLVYGMERELSNKLENIVAKLQKAIAIEIKVLTSKGLEYELVNEARDSGRAL